MNSTGEAYRRQSGVAKHQQDRSVSSPDTSPTPQPGGFEGVGAMAEQLHQLRRGEEPPRARDHKRRAVGGAIETSIPSTPAPTATSTRPGCAPAAGSGAPWPKPAPGIIIVATAQSRTTGTSFLQTRLSPALAGRNDPGGTDGTDFDGGARQPPPPKPPRFEEALKKPQASSHGVASGRV